MHSNETMLEKRPSVAARLQILRIGKIIHSFKFVANGGGASHAILFLDIARHLFAPQHSTQQLHQRFIYLINTFRYFTKRKKKYLIDQK